MERMTPGYKRKHVIKAMIFIKRTITPIRNQKHVILSSCPRKTFYNLQKKSNPQFRFQLSKRIQSTSGHTLHAVLAP